MAGSLVKIDEEIVSSAVSSFSYWNRQHLR